MPGLPQLDDAARAGDLARVRELATAETPPAALASALLWAAERGHAAVVDHVLALGVDVDARDPDGSGITALHLAASNRQLGMVRHLLARGAEAAARDARDVSVLEIAVDAVMPWNHDDGPDDPPSLALVEALLAAGADPNADAFGRGATPLVTAHKLHPPPAGLTAVLRRYGALDSRLPPTP